MLQSGQEAPAFSLTGADGQTYDTAARGNGPLVLFFFKVGCPTCALSFPYMEKLYQTYRDAGLMLWGIAQDPKDKAVQFAQQGGATFPILLDDGYPVSNQFGIHTVPSFYLISRADSVEFERYSFMKDELNLLAGLVAEQVKRPASTLAPADDGKPAFKPG